MNDSIVDVAGVSVGHFSDRRRPTGCTVVLVPEGATCGVDVRGAAPGTRETELLSPLNAVEKVHAVLLAGGSAFGLDAAGGVMRWLEERGIGVEVGPARVPIVPAAILFDLWLGDARIRPDAAAGHAACVAASRDIPAQGNVGAGAGATVGKLFGIERAMRGGIGSAAVTVGGITVGALVAVNALGDVIDPSSGQPVAGARTAGGARLQNSMDALLRGELPAPLQPGAATTLGVIATDAQLTKSQANKIAQMAHDGLARCINPVHTMGDGDTLFALGTGTAGRSTNVTLLGALAAEATTRAVLRAVRAASRLAEPGLPALPCASDLA
ncbi:P1 family peptidase [uncultured Piscinibacter sp.]|uniref:P1 family peptidase n=1 Tax=uncultured Piscinibacter sp. TaxID=1131835 RepID=UPI0026133A22|nr:P1 family peptidase [uncultured Piscinibacter sp.]